MNLETAKRNGARLLELLLVGCESIHLAGGVRREEAVVDRLVLVACPVITDAKDLLSIRLNRLIGDRPAEFKWDEVTKRKGPCYKRFYFDGTLAELFTATPDNWGTVMAYHTGPDNFRDMLFTPRAKGGVLPQEIEQRDGGLYRRGSDELLPTPTESDFFIRLELPWWHPAGRSAVRLKAWLREQHEINQDFFSH